MTVPACLNYYEIIVVSGLDLIKMPEGRALQALLDNGFRIEITKRGIRANRSDADIQLGKFLYVLQALEEMDAPRDRVVGATDFGAAFGLESPSDDPL